MKNRELPAAQAALQTLGAMRLPVPVVVTVVRMRNDAAAAATAADEARVDIVRSLVGEGNPIEPDHELWPEFVSKYTELLDREAEVPNGLALHAVEGGLSWEEDGDPIDAPEGFANMLVALGDLIDLHV